MEHSGINTETTADKMEILSIARQQNSATHLKTGQQFDAKWHKG